jgi:hypothetical protein
MKTKTIYCIYCEEGIAVLNGKHVMQSLDDNDPEDDYVDYTVVCPIAKEFPGYTNGGK